MKNIPLSLLLIFFCCPLYGSLKYPDLREAGDGESRNEEPPSCSLCSKRSDFIRQQAQRIQEQSQRIQLLEKTLREVRAKDKALLNIVESHDLRPRSGRMVIHIFINPDIITRRNSIPISVPVSISFEQFIYLLEYRHDIPLGSKKKIGRIQFNHFSFKERSHGEGRKNLPSKEELLSQLGAKEGKNFVLRIP